MNRYSRRKSRGRNRRHSKPVQFQTLNKTGSTEPTDFKNLAQRFMNIFRTKKNRGKSGKRHRRRY